MAPNDTDTSPAEPPREPSLHAKAVTEFVGTYFLILTIGLLISHPDASVILPIGVAGVLIAMIYAGGCISMAHYNPAATLTLLMQRACKPREALSFLGAQLAAAGSATFTTRLINDPQVLAPMDIDPLQSLVGEFVFTFALCFVILSVATRGRIAGNQFYGLAIGAVVLGGIYAVGPLTSAAFNPAVVVSLVLHGVLDASDAWPHLVGQLSAAVAAALVFRKTETTTTI